MDALIFNQTPNKMKLTADMFNVMPNGKPVEFPKMKKDEVVHYKIRDLRPDPFNEGKILMGASKQVKPADRIVQDDGSIIDIAAIDRINRDGTVKLLNIVFKKQQLGVMQLKGSNGTDQKKYGYMELCNQNASNPNRDKSVKPLFYRVDEIESAKEVNRNMEELAEAMDLVVHLSEDALLEAAAPFGANVNWSNEQLRSHLFKQANEAPAQLLKILKASANLAEGTARKAVKLGVLIHDTKNRTFAFKEGGDPIMTYTKQFGVSEYKMLAEHLNQNPDTLTAIKARLAAKKGSQ